MPSQVSKIASLQPSSYPSLPPEQGPAQGTPILADIHAGLDPEHPHQAVGGSSPLAPRRSIHQLPDGGRRGPCRGRYDSLNAVSRTSASRVNDSRGKDHTRAHASQRRERVKNITRARLSALINEFRRLPGAVCGNDCGCAINPPQAVEDGEEGWEFPRIAAWYRLTTVSSTTSGRSTT